MTVAELVIARIDAPIADLIGFEPEELISVVRETLAATIPQLWTADIISTDPERTDIYHVILLKPEGS